MSEIGYPGTDFGIGNNHSTQIAYTSNDDTDGIGTANRYFETQVVDENGMITETWTDKFGNKVGSSTGRTDQANPDPDNKEVNLTTQFEYNILGNLVKTIPPCGFTCSGWTITKKANADDYATHLKYNSLSQLIAKSTPDMDGDGDGNPTNERLDENADIQYKYDANGNLHFMQDASGKAAGKIIYYRYDALNRLIKEGDAEISSWNNLDPDITYTFENEDGQNEYFYDGLNAYSGAKNIIGKISCIRYKTDTEWSYKYYSYNSMGLIEWYIVQVGSLEKKFEYKYDLLGNITKESYQAGEQDSYYLWYDYNDQGYLSFVYDSQTDAKPANPTVTYQYSVDGSLLEKKYKNGITVIQKIDYRYNPRGWLTAINAETGDINANPGGDLNDRFKMILGYQDVNTALGTALNAQEKYNGNISWVEWKTANQNNDFIDRSGYVYQYDKVNRIRKADYSVHNGSTWSSSNANYDLSNISYDENGNINELNRYGFNMTTAAQMDQLSYTYLSNRLQQIEDSYTTSDFSNIDAEDTQFGYDVNGNLISDSNKGFSNVVYDYRNMPVEVLFGIPVDLILDNITYSANETVEASNSIEANTVTVTNTADITFASGVEIILNPGFHAQSGSIFESIIDENLIGQGGSPDQDDISFNYDDQGLRVKKSVPDHNTEFTYIRDYDGNTFAVYNVSGSLLYHNLNAGGESFGKNVYYEGIYYYIKDHLGNIRVTIDQNGNVASYNDYYPFGLQMEGGHSGNVGLTHDKYKYSGKELDEESAINQYYFGARYYDPSIGRFLTTDPLALSSPALSSYNYCANNPMLIVDPNGLKGYINNETGAYGWFKKDPGEGWSLIYDGEDQEAWNAWLRGNEDIVLVDQQLYHINILEEMVKKGYFNKRGFIMSDPAVSILYYQGTGTLFSTQDLFINGYKAKNLGNASNLLDAEDFLNALSWANVEGLGTYLGKGFGGRAWDTASQTQSKFLSQLRWGNRLPKIGTYGGWGLTGVSLALTSINTTIYLYHGEYKKAGIEALFGFGGTAGAIYTGGVLYTAGAPLTVTFTVPIVVGGTIYYGGKKLAYWTFDIKK